MTDDLPESIVQPRRSPDEQAQSLWDSALASITMIEDIVAAGAKVRVNRPASLPMTADPRQLLHYGLQRRLRDILMLHAVVVDSKGKRGADMTSPFERHGIEHLSASSLALYRAAPALWCLRYLWRVQDEMGAPVWRGKAVEAGCDAILYKNAPDAEAVAIALAAFEIDAAGEASDQIEKERAAIPGMIAQASKLLRPLGEPVARQFKVEQWIDGIEVPIIGYVDYLWPDYLIDLKTTLRLPSEPRPDHCVQVVSYGDATERTAGLVYVTPTKSARFTSLEIDADAARATLRRSAFAVRRLLQTATDREHAAALFCPDMTSFWWSDATRAAALEVWR